ncbi:MFS transporter [Streptomyces sp. NPDC021098]|uniref:MFS transporter n=1 Tax=unclassified Streptomyces TaxID=2593676 RepID=UPI003799FCEF
MTYWFRRKEVATATALFLTAIPASYVIAAPLSALIMDQVHWFGLSGWRWMFILEGAPAVLLGIACFFVLTERPAGAGWLTERQRQWLTAELEREQQANSQARKLSTLKVMADPKVLLLAIGFISATPYVRAAVALCAAGFVHSPVLDMCLIALSLTGMYSFKSPFWALPTLFLTRSTAAVAVAVVNSISNLGGFFGPYAIGWAKDSTGSATGGLLFLGGLTAVACVLTFAVRVSSRPPAGPPVPGEAPRPLRA